AALLTDRHVDNDEAQTATTSNDGSPKSRIWSSSGGDFRDGSSSNPGSDGSRTAAANTIGLNNSGDLDETLEQDFKRDLAADRATDGARGRPSADGGASQRLGTAADRIQTAGDTLTRAAEALSRSVHTADTQKRMEQIEGRLNVNGAAN